MISFKINLFGQYNIFAMVMW